MLAEILTIGDELCRGEIVDTNSTWFAERLWELDITPAWMTSCRDVTADMASALRLACSRADLVVVSGGLGATEDDLTVDVVCALAECEPMVDPEAKERWAERYRATGRVPNSKTERQLRVPAIARVHRNGVGAAPGFEVELFGTPVFCTPGIPREVFSIWDGGIAGRLVALRDVRGQRVHIARKTFRAFGKGESDVSSILDGLVSADDEASESIHYRVSFPELRIKLVVRNRDEARANERLAELEQGLRDRLGAIIFGDEDDTLAAVLGAELAAKEVRLSVAESCTGGLLGAALTDMPGASQFFQGGVISYSNDAKVSMLGVAPGTLESFGAVSEECAKEMAIGVREKFNADIGVAITGIAGPDGGTEEKPLGTVWLGLASKDQVKAFKTVWPGTREQVRRLAVFRALATVRRELRGGFRD